MKQQRIVSQVAGFAMNVIKLIPPLTLTPDDRVWIRDAFDRVIADSHRVPGAIRDLGRTLASHGLKTGAA